MEFSYKEFVRDRYDRGYIIPKWKGFVRFDYARNENVVALIPFNWLFSLAYYTHMIIRDGFYKRYSKHQELMVIYLEKHKL